MLSRLAIVTGDKPSSSVTPGQWFKKILSAWQLVREFGQVSRSWVACSRYSESMPPKPSRGGAPSGEREEKVDENVVQMLRWPPGQGAKYAGRQVGEVEAHHGAGLGLEAVEPRPSRWPGLAAAEPPAKRPFETARRPFEPAEMVIGDGEEDKVEAVGLPPGGGEAPLKGRHRLGVQTSPAEGDPVSVQVEGVVARQLDGPPRQGKGPLGVASAREPSQQGPGGLVQRGGVGGQEAIGLEAVGGGPFGVAECPSDPTPKGVEHEVGGMLRHQPVDGRAPPRLVGRGGAGPSSCDR